MKIYILRHEDRTQDASFFSPLTMTGLENSKKLIEVLDKLHINQIYSSPFIRTLQTIYPYSKKRNILIKMDYSLSEIHLPSLISSNSYGTRLPQYLAESFNYEPKYTSNLQPEEIKYPETEKDVENRLKHFLKNLIMNHGKTDDNIIIVTHQAICNSVLELIYKKGIIKLPKEAISNYQKGAITLVFDNLEWVFKPINWKIK